jgi:hypothetical protein
LIPTASRELGRQTGGAEIDLDAGNLSRVDQIEPDLAIDRRPKDTRNDKEPAILLH